MCIYIYIYMFTMVSAVGCRFRDIPVTKHAAIQVPSKDLCTRITIL